MSSTLTIEEIKEQIQQIRTSAAFVKDRSVEMNDDVGTQAYSKAYATGMNKAADMLEEFLKSKD